MKLKKNKLQRGEDAERRWQEFCFCSSTARIRRRAFLFFSLCFFVYGFKARQSGSCKFNSIDWKLLIAGAEVEYLWGKLLRLSRGRISELGSRAEIINSIIFQSWNWVGLRNSILSLHYVIQLLHIVQIVTLFPHRPQFVLSWSTVDSPNSCFHPSYLI